MPVAFLPPGGRVPCEAGFKSHWRKKFGVSTSSVSSIQSISGSALLTGSNEQLQNAVC